MLKTRILTALVLLIVLIPSLFFGSAFLWTVLTTAIVGVAAWEWGALLGASDKQSKVYAVGVAVLCVLLVFANPADFSYLLYGLAVIFWCVVVPLWLRQKWVLGNTARGWMVGLVVLLPAWLALIQLREVSASLLLSILAIAWVADIAAYFAGRRWGKHKLAPSISPGKTWEGAAGALVGILIYAGLLAIVTQQSFPLIPAVLALGLITAISIIGDLFESLLKRQAGIKDSSQVLPGHGGVLDRIDSLTSVLPVAAAMILLFFP